MITDCLSVKEWHEVIEVVRRAAEPMLGEVVVSRDGERIGVKPLGNDEEKSYELSLDELVRMHRERRYEDIAQYVQVTCALMKGAARPQEGYVLTLADGIAVVWSNGEWKRLFE